MTVAAREFGARLRAARLAAGLDIAEVSRRSAGLMGTAAIASYERGDRDIPLSKLQALCRILGISVDFLFDLTPPPTALEIDLAALQRAPVSLTAPLARFVEAVMSQRGGHAAGTIRLRAGDLDTLTFAYDQRADQLLARLADWGIVRADDETSRTW